MHDYHPTLTTQAQRPACRSRWRSGGRRTRLCSPGTSVPAADSIAAACSGPTSRVCSSPCSTRRSLANSWRGRRAEARLAADTRAQHEQRARAGSAARCRQEERSFTRVSCARVQDRKSGSVPDLPTKPRRWDQVSSKVQVMSEWMGPVRTDLNGQKSHRKSASISHSASLRRRVRVD